jgi:hypothetical protein
MANRIPDPKKHYVRFDIWGTLLIPVELLPSFKDVVVAEREFKGGRNVFKFTGRSIQFETINTDDLIADITAHKLEE